MSGRHQAIAHGHRQEEGGKRYDTSGQPTALAITTCRWHWHWSALHRGGTGGCDDVLDVSLYPPK